MASAPPAASAPPVSTTNKNINSSPVFQFKALPDERIVFAIDLDDEMSKKDFRVATTKPGKARYRMIQHALRSYIHTKSSLNPNHSYAVVTLGEIAFWHQNWSSDPSTIINSINDIRPASPTHFSTFDLSSLFNTVAQNTSYPKSITTTINSPSYDFTLRIIFLYSRSSVIPTFASDPSAFHTFCSTKGTYFDSIFLHDKPSASNKAQQVYDSLTKLEDKLTPQRCYFFENAIGLRKVDLNVAQLLAHPFSRPLQYNYTVKVLPLVTDGFSAPKSTTNTTNTTNTNLNTNSPSTSVSNVASNVASNATALFSKFLPTSSPNRNTITTTTTSSPPPSYNEVTSPTTTTTVVASAPPVPIESTTTTTTTNNNNNNNVVPKPSAPPPPNQI